MKLNYFLSEVEKAKASIKDALENEMLANLYDDDQEALNKINHTIRTLLKQAAIEKIKSADTEQATRTLEEYSELTRELDGILKKENLKPNFIKHLDVKANLLITPVGWSKIFDKE